MNLLYTSLTELVQKGYVVRYLEGNNVIMHFSRNVLHYLILAAPYSHNLVNYA